MKNAASTVTTLLLVLIGTISQPASAQKHDVSGAGSSFAAAAYTSWGFIYSKEKQLTVNDSSTGSGDGIKQVESRNVDFGASDYALPDEDLKKNGLLQFPTLVGGVVPAVNLPGIKAGQLRLTGPLLAAIFAGRVTSWNDTERKDQG